MHLLSFLGILSLHLIAIAAKPSPDDAQPIDPILHEKYTVSESDRKNNYESVLDVVPYCTARYLPWLAKKDSQNFAISPLGNFLNFYMAYYGAQEKTKEYFEKYLLLKKEDSLKVGLQALVDDLATYKGDGLSVANILFHSPELKLLEKYVDTIKRSFRCPIQEVDFTNANGTNDIINTWCEEHTKNRMKYVVESEDALRATALRMTNTVHFKGEWSQKFQSENTKNRPFYTDISSKMMKPTMAIEGTFLHGESSRINATFVKLPFETNDDSHKINMYVVLPESVNGLASFEEHYTDDFSIHELIKGGKLGKVYVQLPKFTFSSKIDLKEGIVRPEGSGQKSLFQEKRANFLGMSENLRLHFKEIVQNSVFKIDEEGSETAAAIECNGAEEFAPTAAAASDDSESPVADGVDSFIANHPFYVFLVVEKESSPLYVSIARFSG